MAVTTFLEASPSIIEGIGRQTQAELERAGIRTLADMVWRGSRAIHRLLAGTSLPEVEGWLAAAALLQVEGVDPNVAEALVKAGIDTVNTLATADLQRVERAMVHAHEHRRIAQVPSLYQLAAIQREAGKLRDTGMMTGRVNDAESGTPLSGLTVRALGVTTETDSAGRFSLIGVPEGDTRLHIWFAGREVLSVQVTIRTGALTPPFAFRLKPRQPGAPPPRVAHESRGDYVVLGRGSTSRLAERQLQDLPDDTYLLVREPQEDGTVRLLHLYRARVGPDVFSEVVSVKKPLLPQGAAMGDVVQLHAGALAATTLTIHDVARKKFEALIRRPLEVRTRRIHMRAGTPVPRESSGAGGR